MRTLVLITNIPNPYRVPLFNELNRLLEIEGWKLHVVFAARTYARRYFHLDEKTFAFDHHFLGGESTVIGDDNEKTVFHYTGLWKHLSQLKPHAIVVAGFSSATMQVAAFSKLKGIPFIIWSGAILQPHRNDSFIRRLQRRFLVLLASGFVAYGSRAKVYLEQLGAPADRCEIAINTVDTEFFTTETKALRETAGKPEKTILTCIGYLVPRKNIRALLEAIAVVAQKRRDFRLEIIGDGPSKAELEQFCSDQNLNDLVHFAGFREKEELPGYLAHSSGMLFQTDFDIWGLVLNESMAAGLPCIASIHAGAVNDLIIDGETGFSADFSHSEETAKKINYLLDHPEETAQMGERAAHFIRTKANLTISAGGFLKVLKKIV